MPRFEISVEETYTEECTDRVDYEVTADTIEEAQRLVLHGHGLEKWRKNKDVTSSIIERTLLGRAARPNSTAPSSTSAPTTIDSMKFLAE